MWLNHAEFRGKSYFNSFEIIFRRKMELSSNFSARVSWITSYKHLELHGCQKVIQ